MCFLVELRNEEAKRNIPGPMQLKAKIICFPHSNLEDNVVRILPILTMLPHFESDIYCQYVRFPYKHGASTQKRTKKVQTQTKAETKREMGDKGIEKRIIVGLFFIINFSLD